MPEGVEIEYYRRAAATTIGRRVERVDAPDDWFLKRGTTALDLRDALTGETVVGVERTGKLLVMIFGNAADDPHGAATARLGLRFGMTGRLLVDGEGPIDYLEYASKRNNPAWDRFVLHFSDGGDLRIRDPRRLGGVELEPDEDALGVDLFAAETDDVIAKVAVGNAAIKSRLLDQSRIAGVGNLIADETLWRAGIDPARKAGSITAAECERLGRSLHEVAEEFLAAGGSHMGKLQDARVRGGACPSCGRELTRRSVGGRTTFSCAHHQR